MRMEAEGRRLLAAAAAQTGPVDLVSKVIQPWSAELAVAMSGAEGDAARRLRRLARVIFYKQEPRQISLAWRALGYPGRRARGLRRAWAMRALTRMLERRELPMGRSTFAGVTQTLPSFIAKAWLALLQHPEQMERLRLQPEMAASAAEELLRYAGIVHTLHRHASREATIGEARIAAGQRVLLRLGDANFDPEKFSEPERLDVGRPASGQLALGRGLHACVGAVVARIGASVMLPLLAEAALVLERGRRMAWIEDSSLRWPRELWVRFAKR
jgi:cytochrome P450